jgi:hypothetical protein
MPTEGLESAERRFTETARSLLKAGYVAFGALKRNRTVMTSLVIVRTVAAANSAVAA